MEEIELSRPYLEKLLEQIIDFIPDFFMALAIFLLALLVSELARRAVNHALQFRHMDPELRMLFSRIVRWGIIIFGIVLALQQVHFNIASFMAGLGIVGFTIGFAFQDIAKNFIAGVLLLLQQPFDIGDAIEVSGFAGTVITIEIRSTTIRTWDGKHVIIPNADVYTSSITNFTRSPRRRLALEIGVAYGSDLEHVTAVLQETIGQVEKIIQDDPAPTIVFDAFGDSAINITMYYWVDTADIGMLDAKTTVLKAVKKAFEAEGIDIPFPMQTVMVNKAS